MSWTYTLRIVFQRAEVGDDGVEKWISAGGWEMYYGTIKGPMRKDVTNERALKWRRVCPTRVVVPLVALVKMLFMGPDQGYQVYADIPWVARERERARAWVNFLMENDD